MNKKIFLFLPLFSLLAQVLDARHVFVTWVNETDESAHISSKPWERYIFLLEPGKSREFPFQVDDAQIFSDRIKAGPTSGWDSLMQAINLPAGINPLYLKYRYCLGQDGKKALLVETILSDE